MEEGKTVGRKDRREEVKLSFARVVAAVTRAPRHRVYRLLCVCPVPGEKVLPLVLSCGPSIFAIAESALPLIPKTRVEWKHREIAADVYFLNEFLTINIRF